MVFVPLKSINGFIISVRNYLNSIDREKVNVLNIREVKQHCKRKLISTCKNIIEP